MHINFANNMRNFNIDLNKEYVKLVELLHGFPAKNSTSLYNVLSCSFIDFSFRGTCLTIEEFNDLHNFKTVDSNKAGVEDLIILCEYIWNMLTEYERVIKKQTCEFEDIDYAIFESKIYFDQINALIEKLGYEHSKQDGYEIFIKKNAVARMVAESSLIPQNASYKIINHSHYSKKDNLDDKKEILYQFASILEPYRKKLKEINNQLEDDLFFIFNNFNIRHNNIDPNSGGKYKKYVAEMNNTQLCDLYDNTYDMCLLAIMLLDYDETSKNIKNVISECKSKK